MAVTLPDLPRWRCHKVVRAAKIRRIIQLPGGGAVLLFDEAVKEIDVEEAWITKHAPSGDGYYVVYEDGYASWSPAAAFESGYDLIPEVVHA